MKAPGIKRREFLGAIGLAVAGSKSWVQAARTTLGAESTLKFGLVTYLWGRDLEIGDLITTCRAAGLDGVELRTSHAHGVEPGLDARARGQVRERFQDSGVVLVGIGSNERFDSPEPETLARAVGATREYLRLCADVGGSGVKVKPDSFHAGVDPEATIEQVGRTLGALGAEAADLGQELRLEVHGGMSDPEVIARIIEVADHPAVKACWNCNARDLRGGGFLRNYQQLRPYFGGTLHCRRLDGGMYPSMDLLSLLKDDGYEGFVLLEAHSQPPRHRVSAMGNQRALFDRYATQSKRRAVSTEIAIAPQSGNKNLIDVMHGKELFLTCRIGNENPSLFPLNAPGERLAVRAFPFGHNAGEARDHPHHRSCWLAHGDIDGHDFWHDEKCRIRVREHEIDGNTLHWSADWIAPGGKRIAVENRAMHFSGNGDHRRIEFDMSLTPDGDAMTFGDTKEGTFAIRVAPSMRLRGQKALGRIENAEGMRDGDCWGKRSPWVLYEGPVDGRMVRLRIADHPGNPRHPTWWHARDYGLFAANPFGQGDFEPGSPRMPLVVGKSDPLRLRYTVDISTGIG